MMDEEVDKIKDILRDAGYEVFDIDGPLEPLEPIQEAVKKASKHWP